MWKNQIRFKKTKTKQTFSIIKCPHKKQWNIQFEKSQGTFRKDNFKKSVALLYRIKWYMYIYKMCNLIEWIGYCMMKYITYLQLHFQKKAFSGVFGCFVKTK